MTSMARGCVCRDVVDGAVAVGLDIAAKAVVYDGIDVFEGVLAVAVVADAAAVLDQKMKEKKCSRAEVKEGVVAAVAVAVAAVVAAVAAVVATVATGGAVPVVAVAPVVPQLITY
ncbi:MAG: hypothetical protein J3R72DRAFT_416528 [Linnemannia gamsii]|nr:MAG: hypothetical protein J3R72DRAFT_416528 [Linnemannia gamsii]